MVFHVSLFYNSPWEVRNDSHFTSLFSGSFILVDVDRAENSVMNALLGTWPLGLVVIAAAGVSGIIIWLLVRFYVDHIDC